MIFRVLMMYALYRTAWVMDRIAIAGVHIVFGLVWIVEKLEPETDFNQGLTRKQREAK